MSRKICNKNIERDSLRATIKVMESSAESKATNARAIAGMKQQLLAKTYIVASVCPMCKRVFHPGDALCGCRAATTKSVRVRGADGRQVKGEKRVKNFKCLERVVQPLANRHAIRGQMKRIIKNDRQYRAMLRHVKSQLVSRSVTKFNPEAPGAVGEGSANV